jgi:anti-sigma B factor antagonist
MNVTVVEVSGDIDVGSRDSGTSDTVAIHGRITVQNSGEMRAALANALRSKSASLSVDLSGVSYIDTSGLATLLEASRIARKQGTRLILSGIHDQPRYIFEITDLDRLFDIAGKEESA